MQQSCVHLIGCAHGTVALIQTLCNEEADPNTLGRFPGMRANTGGEALSHVRSSTLCALASMETLPPCRALDSRCNLIPAAQQETPDFPEKSSYML